jgi:hypothetical protein
MLQQGFCLAQEIAFEDCYFRLPSDKNDGDEAKSRQWWLRRRTRLLPSLQEQGFTLGETWKGKELFAGVNEFNGELMKQKLASLGVAEISSLEVLVKFRFFRRSLETSSFGVLNLDRTLYGTRLMAKVTTKEQFDAVLKQFGGLKLTVSKAIEMIESEKNNTPIFTARFKLDELDFLMGSLSDEDEDDGDGADEDEDSNVAEVENVVTIQDDQAGSSSLSPFGQNLHLVWKEIFHSLFENAEGLEGRL